MSLKETFSKAAHAAASLVVDTDGSDQKKPASAAAPHPAFNLTPGALSAAAAPAPAGSPFAIPATQVVDEGVYQSVLKKTNFDDTPVGKTIHGYYDGLEDMDVNARFRTAFKLAAKRDGITADQVLATFDSLQAALDKDAQGFQNVAATVEANQITSRQNEKMKLQNEIDERLRRMAQIDSELATEIPNHANAVTQYGLAQQRRAQEIAQQKATFASLLH